MLERQPNRQLRIVFNILGLFPGALAVNVLTGEADTLMHRWGLQENASQTAWIILGVSALFIVAGQVRIKKN